MKKVFSIILFGFTVLTMAQNGPSNKGNHSQMTPEQNAIIQTKKLTLALDLNQIQQNKILELNKKMAINRDQMRTKNKEAKQNNSSMTSDEKFEMQNKMLDAQLKHQTEIKKILNEKQYTDWKQMQKRKNQQCKKQGNRGQNKKPMAK